MSIAEKLTTVAENQQKVFDAGRTAEWSDFWDTYQVNGTRTDYNYAFQSASWTDANFKPKYDIAAKSAAQMFASTKIKDVAGCLKRAGVTMDTSLVSSFSYTFYSEFIETLPVISTVSASKFSYTFYNAQKLHTIEKLILKDDGSQTHDYTFVLCSALENIVIEGCIGQNTGFSYSPKLTHDSLMSIINALKDYSSDTSGTTYKLTLGTTNLAKLADTEKAIATQKGWTLA